MAICSHIFIVKLWDAEQTVESNIFISSGNIAEVVIRLGARSLEEVLPPIPVDQNLIEPELETGGC